MRTLKFWGTSDDLFEIDGTAGNEPDEVGCFDRPAVAKIEAADGAVCVVALYAPANAAACWAIGLMPVDENVPIPPWPVTFTLAGSRPGHEYSAGLTITVPDGAVVSVVRQEADDDL